MAGSPYERQAQMFPRLEASQLEKVKPYGRARHVDRGELLFDIGDREVPFFVVLSGELEIVRPDRDGEDVVTVHQPGEFTGEINMLSGRANLVQGRMKTPGEVIELDRPAFRKLLAADADLSELFMRAFIVRRVGLITHEQGDIIVLGSEFSADTLRLKQFLSRNGHPYQYTDVERDDEAMALLDRFQVSAEEVPLVYFTAKDTVIKNPTNRQIADCLGFSGDIDEDAVHDVVVVGAGPRGLRPRCTLPPKGSTWWSSRATSLGARRVRARRSRTISVFRRAFQVRRLPAGPTTRRRSLEHRSWLRASRVGSNVPSVRTHCSSKTAIGSKPARS